MLQASSPDFRNIAPSGKVGSGTDTIAEVTITQSGCELQNCLSIDSQGRTHQRSQLPVVLLSARQQEVDVPRGQELAPDRLFNLLLKPTTKNGDAGRKHGPW
jgi:hypothetical protein